MGRTIDIREELNDGEIDTIVFGIEDDGISFKLILERDHLFISSSSKRIEICEDEIDDLIKALKKAKSLNWGK